MQILCNTTFLDGTDRFEKDDKRTVSNERGQYFVSKGWATNAETGESGGTDSNDLTLNVDGGGSDTSDNSGE